MNQKDIMDLTRIYHTLLLISTKGEDTIIMGDCLKAFQTFIMEHQNDVANNLGGE